MKRNHKFLAILLTFVLVISLGMPVVQANKNSNTEFEPENPGIKDEQTAVGEKGMVVTAHPLASKVGAEVLERGGNAVDAAVAIQFALNVAEPMMSGIGGGGFMMYYDAAEEKVSIIDSRERAPAGATSDMFMDKSNDEGKPLPFSDRVESGLSVGVPGTLKGLEVALDKWGTLPLKELIQPSVDMAEQGIPVNWALAKGITGSQSKLAKSVAKDVFLPGGEPLKEGDLLIQKDLAKTFKLIGEKGSDVFYKGEIGAAIADVVQEYNGSMTLDDLKRYDVTHDLPVWGDYKGYDIATMPPPSSGGLTMLQLLKKFDMLDLTQYDVKSKEKYHLMAEAMHLAYADRGAYMGDPEHVEVPEKGLLDPTYLGTRVDMINHEKANSNVKAGNPWDYQDGKSPVASTQVKDDKVDGETTHFTVADQWGNFVSYTTTIEQVFGSGIMAPGTGVLLNNELTDFDAVPGGVNEVQPNKRPLSSMTPTIVFKDGKPFMTVGSPGGATIITSVTQVVLNVIGYEMGIKDAIEEPRIYSNSYPNIRWEYGMPGDVQDQLKQMGHTLEEKPQEIGNVNSILVNEDGVYVGAADSTREGTAIGVSKVNKPVDFTDISDSWAKEFIEKAVGAGVIKGYPDGTFKPNKNLTRAQAASLLVRALDLQSDEIAPFKDIGGYATETKAEINAAYKFKIVKGQDGNFKPGEHVTRAQMALMIYRAYEYKTGMKYTPSKKAPYSDFGTYDVETVDAISMLHELGIATGSNGKFNPSNPTTRAHAAKILVNFIENAE